MTQGAQRPRVQQRPPPSKAASRADYRIYLLDESGRIARVHELRCADDEAALAAAEARMAGNFRLEIWQRARFVATVPPNRVGALLRQLKPKPDARASAYRAQAAIMLSMAARAPSDELRTAYGDLAAKWYALADSREQAS